MTLSPSTIVYRRGYHLVELIGAIALIGVAISISVGLIAGVARFDKAERRRELAILEATNQLEQLSAFSWDDLTPEHAKAIELSPEAAAGLPKGTLAVSIEQAKTEPELKKIGVTVKWNSGNAAADRPVELVTWIARRRTPKP